jgi:biotin synthase
MAAPIATDRRLERAKILAWLREDDETILAALWAAADAVRRAHVGDAVHLRGLIEISNHCVRHCAYCGINAGNLALERYRLTADEIMACVGKAAAFGYGTVVMQAGEDYVIGERWLSDLIRQIKAETPLAVTLSLGERREHELAAWLAAGADRYLLRFETSDRALYERIHPPLSDQQVSDRPALLRRLRELGYEIGSGVMVGIPGQTYESLADDLELMRSLDLDMIGIGPYLPHPATDLVRQGLDHAAASDTQVPNTELMTLKMVALARLCCPDANIPSTTALATINEASGREHGLQRGANIVMPNLTPAACRVKYEIYPGKACVSETAEHCDACIKGRIRRIGRTIGTGRGDSPRQDKGRGARGEGRGEERKGRGARGEGRGATQ